MGFDIRGWLRQPSTITGVATFAAGAIASGAHYFTGDVTLDVYVGGIVFGLTHLVLNDNTQAAADAQALAIDVTKGVANHAISVAIPEIVRDAVKLANDIRAPASVKSTGAAATLIALALLTSCSAPQVATAQKVVVDGQLFCAKALAAEPLVVALADVSGVPVTVTDKPKAFVDTACAVIGAIPVSPPANPAAAPTVAVVLPNGAGA